MCESSRRVLATRRLMRQRRCTRWICRRDLTPRASSSSTTPRVRLMPTKSRPNFDCAIETERPTRLGTEWPPIGMPPTMPVRESSSSRSLHSSYQPLKPCSSSQTRRQPRRFVSISWLTWTAKPRPLRMLWISSCRSSRDWVATQSSRVDGFGTAAPVARAIVDRSQTAADRMSATVELLRQEDQQDLRTAFALGMAAMRLQMRQARILEGEDPNSIQEPAWRPFQLGFILVSLASVVDEHHADRELVDLIWFPTGGGKTEAYLGLAAIEMFRRRLVHGQEGGGTAIITRYTLRLLTAQQFHRASSLICAMELLRRPDRIADARASGLAAFSIGLWVGNDVTPGTRLQARKALDRLLKAARPEEANQFQVEGCPWCGTSLLPNRHSTNLEDYGICAVGNDVVIRCTNANCEFHARLASGSRGRGPLREPSLVPARDRRQVRTSSIQDRSRAAARPERSLPATVDDHSGRVAPPVGPVGNNCCCLRRRDPDSAANGKARHRRSSLQPLRSAPPRNRFAASTDETSRSIHPPDWTTTETSSRNQLSQARAVSIWVSCLSRCRRRRPSSQRRRHSSSCPKCLSRQARNPRMRTGRQSCITTACESWGARERLWSTT